MAAVIFAMDGLLSAHRTGCRVIMVSDDEVEGFMESVFLSFMR